MQLRTIALSALVSSVGVSTVHAQTVEVGPITNPANGHRYYRLTASNWLNAEAFAHSLGGHLATIEDAAENEWIRVNLVVPGGTFGWIGLNRTGNAPNFSWASGSAAAFRQWDPGEPNDSGGLGEYFVDMLPNGNWNDHYDNPAQKGIVEIEPISIDWYTIDGGGAMNLAGGSLTVSGTLAQPDAGRFDTPNKGGDVEAVGGFWAVAIPPPFCPCPADFDGSGGTPDTTDIAAFFTSWLLGDATADTDCSGGTPDTQDIDTFFIAWLAGGC